MDQTKEQTSQKVEHTKLSVPKEFNPRILEVTMKDERFFAFESQRSHH